MTDAWPAEIDRAQLGVVLVDHGSRQAESNAMFERFVAGFAEGAGYGVVEAAHMELAPPSIGDAFGRCAERGARAVVVSPYFLLPGRHWQRDIPQLAAEAAARHGLPFFVAAPIGLHPLMADVIGSRIEHCLARVAGSGAGCEACEGGRGGCGAGGGAAGV